MGPVRDDIYRQVMERGWNAERGAFVQHYDTDVLDASLLLMPLTKFMAPTDPLWLSTLDVMSNELVSDSLVYRYNVEASPDGLKGDEGTFSICSFWYVEALARAGHVDEARLAFEKMLTYANHVGLYSGGDRSDRRAARQLPAGLHAPPPGAVRRRGPPRRPGAQGSSWGGGGVVIIRGPNPPPRGRGGAKRFSGQRGGARLQAAEEPPVGQERRQEPLLDQALGREILAPSSPVGLRRRRRAGTRRPDDVLARRPQRALRPLGRAAAVVAVTGELQGFGEQGAPGAGRHRHRARPGRGCRAQPR